MQRHTANIRLNICIIFSFLDVSSNIRKHVINVIEITDKMRAMISVSIGLSFLKEEYSTP